MSEQLHTPVTGAQDRADANIAGAFSFLRAALADPGLVRDGPARGVAEFGTIVVHGHEFEFVLEWTEGAQAWTARVFRYAAHEGALPFRRPAPGPAVRPLDFGASVRRLRVVESDRAEAAAGIRRALTDAVERAVRGASALPKR